MFTIIRRSNGTFRLELHDPPSRMEADEVEELRSVILALAEGLQESSEPASGAASRRFVTPPARAGNR